ncbi:hypothetical protein [Mitsuokella sp.]|uniref:hypothetical protein n=1 Tax=Mitsuokella sp. TaxID=2049034 RepID=UPI003D7C6D1C
MMESNKSQDYKYDPFALSQEIIDVLAKYRVPYTMLPRIFQFTKDLIESRMVVSNESMQAVEGRNIYAER